MKGVGVHRLSFVSEWWVNWCQLWTCAFLHEQFVLFLALVKGNGVQSWPPISGIILFLFCRSFFLLLFVFQFLVELCVWVKLKRMNKDRYKLAFPVWAIDLFANLLMVAIRMNHRSYLITYKNNQYISVQDLRKCSLKNKRPSLNFGKLLGLVRPGGQSA